MENTIFTTGKGTFEIEPLDTTRNQLYTYDRDRKYFICVGEYEQKIPDNMEFIGIYPTTITEEKARGIVDECKELFGRKYYNYNKGAHICNSAIECLSSKFQSEKLESKYNIRYTEYLILKKVR